MNINWHLTNRADTERRRMAAGFADAVGPDSENCYTLTTPGVMGKIVVRNAVEIEAAFHYNGSGARAFGGSESWPFVTLKVPFAEGDVAGRDAFIKRLQAFLNADPAINTDMAENKPN